VKIWDGASLTEQRVLPKQPDWPLDLALSPDDRRLAVTRYDGSIGIYEMETGRLLVTAPPVGPPVRKGTPR
jgi:hypothetical protein